MYLDKRNREIAIPKNKRQILSDKKVSFLDRRIYNTTMIPEPMTILSIILKSELVNP
jgi:hypothetical protein